MRAHPRPRRRTRALLLHRHQHHLLRAACAEVESPAAAAAKSAAGEQVLLAAAGQSAHRGSPSCRRARQPAACHTRHALQSSSHGLLAAPARARDGRRVAGAAFALRHV
jgi:hypothetical protein